MYDPAILSSPGTFKNNAARFIVRPVKFIAPNGYTIHRVKIGIGCPLFFIDKYPEKDKRSVRIRLRCADPASVVVDYTLNNKKKDTALLKRRTFLALLKYNETKLKCAVRKESFFGRLFDWSPKTRGEIRRKYYVSVSN